MYSAENRTRQASPDAARTPPLEPARFQTTEAEPMSIDDVRDALVIRNNGAFLLMDRDGDVPSGNRAGLGFYRDDTRFLSRYEFGFSDVAPVRMLTTAALGFAAEQVFTNPSMFTVDGQALPRAGVEVRRQRAIGSVLEERLRITSFQAQPIELEFRYAFDTDFADILEVRGFNRTRRRIETLRPDGRSLVFRYHSRDGLCIGTRVEFSEEPYTVSGNGAAFRFWLNPHEPRTLRLTISTFQDVAAAAPPEADLLGRLEGARQGWRDSCTSIVSSNDIFNAVLEQSLNDLRTLWNEDEAGGYLAAGTPWFDTLFGRDSVIASLQTLAFQPSIARQTLRVLAARQGRELNDWRDEEPGKILHETRRGEAARTGDVPFELYYGSIDSTPLFLLLAAEYWQWTGDAKLLRELVPALRAGLDWTHQYGDLDGDGLLEYAQRSERGLLNQGWKDSGDAMVGLDGALARQPIAPVEVQGYLYAAKRGLACVFEALKDAKTAATLRHEAAELRARIEKSFWMESGFYAMALDGDKRQVASRSSNPAHLLYTGVPSPIRARRVATGLLAPDLFSGWGIRTLSASSPRFNPFGYHVGTVWPHDNAIAAMGLKKYGREPELQSLATALFDAARSFEYYRLPELFCGTPRSTHRAPVPYPVACRPQAWAAGTIPLVLQAMLGLCPAAGKEELLVVRPQLPPWLEAVQVRNLKVGKASVDLDYERRSGRTRVAVLNASAGLRVTLAARWPS
jgi:glycogen debranching enzyme